MKRAVLLCGILLPGLMATGASAQGWPSAEVLAFQTDARATDRAARDASYQAGLKELDEREWDRAIASFKEAAAHQKDVADAAMYWKAYAENRAGRRQEALAAIDALRQAYPSSRWINDAGALELEMRAQSGTPVSPSSQPDEELKLMALNSLMQADPQQALPILRKLLTGNDSEKVKGQAMFVLAQNPSPEARKLVAEMARDGSNPDLQRKAIRYIGMMGNDESKKELASIYNSSSDVRLKSEILRSFMISGSRDFLLNVAKTEQNQQLRRDAIRQLALTGGQNELWQLYGSGNSEESKKAILQSMFLGGNADRLVEIARTEKDPALRASAIQSLGLMGNRGNGDALVSIYQSDSNPEVRKAVLNALFIQQNGKALVQLARNEKDPRMKQEIVQKMALVHSKETTDYMLEVLR